MMNSNDIFSQIGLILSPKKQKPKNNPPESNAKPIFLEIQLGEDQKHLLEVNENDDPNLVAQKFCHQHRLNKLAVSIIEQKIIEAKRHEKEKVSSSNNQTPKQNRNTALDNDRSRSGRNTSSSVTPKKNKNSTKGKDDIYLRGLVKSRLKEEQKARKKVQQDNKQQEELTFKPNINKVSEKIVEFIRENPKKQKKKSPPKKMYDQLQQCTFKPKINKTSQRIIENKSTLEEERLREKQVASSNKVSRTKQMDHSQELFKPKINPKSAQTVTIPFFQRLQIAMDKKNKILTQSSISDDEQCSFHPKILRGPRTRNKQNAPIWQHLYNQSKKDKEKTRQKDQRQLMHQKSAQKIHSQNYYENLVDDRIRQVFQTLDSDFDGIISPEKIGIQFLPTSSLIFLKPIFMQMDSINASLTYSQFKRAVVALMGDSDPGTKGAFISEKWKKQEVHQEFKPTINTRSKHLAMNRSVQNLYRDGLKEKQTREYRLERERALKEEKELEECSFKPSLNHSSKIYINKIIQKKEGERNLHDIDQLIHSFMNESQD